MTFDPIRKSLFEMQVELVDVGIPVGVDLADLEAIFASRPIESPANRLDEVHRREPWRPKKFAAAVIPSGSKTVPLTLNCHFELMKEPEPALPCRRARRPRRWRCSSSKIVRIDDRSGADRLRPIVVGEARPEAPAVGEPFDDLQLYAVVDHRVVRPVLRSRRRRRVGTRREAVVRLTEERRSRPRPSLSRSRCRRAGNRYRVTPTIGCAAGGKRGNSEISRDAMGVRDRGRRSEKICRSAPTMNSSVCGGFKFGEI